MFQPVECESSSAAIPRILHRIVLPPMTASGEVERYWHTLARLHPDWEMRTWSGPLDPDEWELGGLFAECNTVAGVADLLRLEILWRHGGIYLDTDCEPVRSMDPLLAYSFFIGTEDGRFLTNSVMGSVPQHPAIRSYMDAILQEHRTSLDVAPNEATGPFLATEVLGQRDDVTVLPPECFYPEPFAARSARVRQTSQELATPFTYVVHRWASSWTPEPELDLSLRGRIRPLASVPRQARRRLRGALGRVARQTRRRWDQLSADRRGGTHACYIGDKRVVIGLPDNLRLIALADDLSLTPELVTMGIYDQFYWDFLGRVLRPGDRVIDVGANIGLFTVRMASLVGRFGHVDAFEVDPDLLALLADNVQINWFNDRVAIHSKAVGGTDGDILVSRYSHLRMLSRAGKPEHQRSDVTQECDYLPSQSCRLDDVIPVGLPIRLVKIDVEGGEADVLEGMQGLLESGALQIIDLEVVRLNTGSDWRCLVDGMRRLQDVYGAHVYLPSWRGELQPTTLDHVIATAGGFPHVIFSLRDVGEGKQ